MVRIENDILKKKLEEFFEEYGTISTTFLQKKLKISHDDAQKIVDEETKKIENFEFC